jgi:hypothetical protein
VFSANNAEYERMSQLHVLDQQSSCFVQSTTYVYVSPVISVALKVGIEYTVYPKRSFTRKTSLPTVARQPKSDPVHTGHQHLQYMVHPDDITISELQVS